jgi:hypothetical protein
MAATKNDRIYYNCLTADALRKAGVPVGVVFLKKIMDLKGVSEVYERVCSIEGGTDFLRESGVRAAVDKWLDEVSSKDDKHRQHVDTVRSDIRSWFLDHRDEGTLFCKLEDFNREAMKMALDDKKRADRDFAFSRVEERKAWMDLYDQAVRERNDETAKKYRNMIIHG